MSGVHPVLAFVLMVLVVSMLLWAVFGDDPASIYDEDDDDPPNPLPPGYGGWYDP